MSCSLRNKRSTRLGVERTNSHEIVSSRSDPITNPISGEMKMKATVLSRPAGISAQMPALATPAPTMPPIRACEDEDGMP